MSYTDHSPVGPQGEQPTVCESRDTTLDKPGPGSFVAISEANVPSAAPVPPVVIMPGMRRDGRFLLRDFGRPMAQILRIVVLKLDHFGDFVIALPALRALRAAFPQAVIRMVCGRWNVDNAQSSGLVDQVRGFDFFPEQALAWDGKPVQGLELFDAAVEGHWDLAIDLRVDEDTRYLLGRVAARLRCGIGSAKRFPLLDVALPLEQPQRNHQILSRAGDEFLPPSRFTSLMDNREDFLHETRLAGADRPVVFGPYVRLPRGKLQATFALEVAGLLPGPRPFQIAVDVLSDGRRMHAQTSVSRHAFGSLRRSPMVMSFCNDDEQALFEFRVHLRGRRLRARLRFAGVQLKMVDSPFAARFHPSELHIGEKLALLVSLVEQRALDVYRDPPELPGSGSGQRVVIAPCSNSTVRDWPIAQYAALVGLLLERPDREVVLVGAPSQASHVASIAERNQSPRLRNLVGQTKWADLPGILTSADLVICNNSGVAHQAASLGVRTLAIYSGSHQPQEWGPRGARSRAIMAGVECSPCGLEAIELCPNDHACMKLITPEYVMRHVDECLGSTHIPSHITEAA